MHIGVSCHPALGCLQVRLWTTGASNPESLGWDYNPLTTNPSSLLCVLRVEPDRYWIFDSDIDILADIQNIDISAFIQYIYRGILGVEQLLGIGCSPSSNASGPSDITFKS